MTSKILATTNHHQNLAGVSRSLPNRFVFFPYVVSYLGNYLCIKNIVLGVIVDYCLDLIQVWGIIAFVFEKLTFIFVTKLKA